MTAAPVRDLLREDMTEWHGRFYDPVFARVPKAPVKRCFRNAYELARRRGLRYAEGFAAGIIPVLHAWCLDDAGHIADPTWRERGAVYFGVEVPLDTVERIQCVTPDLRCVRVLPLAGGAGYSDRAGRLARLLQ